MTSQSDARAFNDLLAREKLQAREKEFNDKLIAQAREKGHAVAAIAPDGCEVTASPSGHVFYNAADWW